MTRRVACYSAQAQRLVKNSIIAVEAPDEDMAEEDYVEDEAEFEDVARRPRSVPSGGAGPGPDDNEDGAMPVLATSPEHPLLHSVPKGAAASPKGCVIQLSGGSASRMLMQRCWQA